jgi:hypothetical protein
MSKRIIALPIALIAIAAFAPGIANATNSTISISILSSGNGFSGKVGPGSCDSGRTVQLKRAPSGSSNFSIIGSDGTDAAGNWKVTKTVQVNAKYKATVVKKGACTAKDSKILTARETKSNIAIETPNGNGFKGKITSTPDCVSGRTVKLQRSTGGAFQTVGSPTTSASNGAWSVATNPVNNAQYRGNISAKTVGTDACMAAFSSVTTARNSSVSIQQGVGNFNGTVTAVSACQNNRTVTLQRSVSSGPFLNQGSDATNASGDWQVNTAVVTGAEYRAFVGARQAGANSCLDDFSPTIVGT